MPRKKQINRASYRGIHTDDDYGRDVGRHGGFDMVLAMTLTPAIATLINIVNKSHICFLYRGYTCIITSPIAIARPATHESSGHSQARFLHCHRQ